MGRHQVRAQVLEDRADLAQGERVMDGMDRHDQVAQEDSRYPLGAEHVHEQSRAARDHRAAMTLGVETDGEIAHMDLHAADRMRSGDDVRDVHAGIPAVGRWRRGTRNPCRQGGNRCLGAGPTEFVEAEATGRPHGAKTIPRRGRLEPVSESPLRDAGEAAADS